MRLKLLALRILYAKKKKDSLGLEALRLSRTSGNGVPAAKPARPKARQRRKLMKASIFNAGRGLEWFLGSQSSGECSGWSGGGRVVGLRGCIPYILPRNPAFEGW